MKQVKKQLFPLHFAPGKKVFFIVVKLSDAPGSFSSILDLVSKRVNFVGTSTYTLGDGTAIFSGFSEGLSPKDTPEDIKNLVLNSRAAIDAEVYEGNDGLLVDSFHTGLTVGGDDVLQFRRDGFTHMFDEIIKYFGSGGDSLLYQNGMAIGKRNAELMVKTVGFERVKAQAGNLNRFLTVQGWGVITGTGNPMKEPITITIEDCFECSSGRGVRKGCNFMRGYLTGAAGVAFSGNYLSEETKCRLRGAKFCEFKLTLTR